MERTLKTPHTLFLAPSEHGWRMARGGANGSVHEFATLGEATSAVEEKDHVHLALPARLVMLERMRLPSTDKNELADMARLQLEKSLPFPLEEVASDCDVLHTGEGESTILAVAAHEPQLDELCQPLREQQRWPDRITVHVMHAATLCPPHGSALLIYTEGGDDVLAVCENAKLVGMQIVEASEIAQELPSFLFAAELDGLPVHYECVCIDKGCEAEVRPLLEGLVSAPIRIISVADAIAAKIHGNLVPHTWREERRLAERGAKIKARLLAAGAVWLAIILLGAGWMFFLKGRVGRLNAKIAGVQPDMDFIQAQKERWLALAPAIEPGRYVVEILRLLQAGMPSADLRFTQFEYTPKQFMIEGEAPTATQAIEFVNKLKASPGLSDFSITASAPAILPNDHAQFRIFGKL